MHPLVRLVTASLLLGPSLARANLRAPHVIPAADSGALSPPAPSLRVLGEQLRFECGASDCAVSARYRIRAEGAARYAFEFLLPVDKPVTARVLGSDGLPGDAAPVTARPAPEPPSDDKGSPRSRRDRDAAPQLVARFEAGLPDGESTLEVRYTQPLGATEHDYGYFKKHGRFVEHFDYLLGPLKQWTLDDQLALAVEVSMEREPPGFWKRRFGTVRSLTCRDAASPYGPPALDAGATRTQDSGRYTLGFTLRGRAFPDRMTCYLGDEDLLPKQ